MVKKWTKAENIAQILENTELVVASGVKCWKITKEGKKEIPDLEAQHEEADTRLALHAAHAAKAGKQSVIIIISEDTDVFLICLAHCSMIGVPIFQKTGP